MKRKNLLEQNKLPEAFNLAGETDCDLSLLMLTPMCCRKRTSWYGRVDEAH